MKKVSFGVLLLWIVTDCAISPQPRGIQPHFVAGRPAVFCEVVTPPAPVLTGAWKCVHAKFVPKLGNDELEPIEYWLGKYGSEYGLYFYREKKGGDKIYSGWRQWTIDGNEIHSKTGVRIFTENGKVYYSWKGDKPTEMTPLELKKGR